MSFFKSSSDTMNEWKRIHCNIHYSFWVICKNPVRMNLPSITINYNIQLILLWWKNTYLTITICVKLISHLGATRDIWKNTFSTFIHYKLRIKLQFHVVKEWVRIFTTKLLIKLRLRLNIRCSISFQASFYQHFLNSFQSLLIFHASSTVSNSTQTT